MPDLEISKLPELSGPGLNGNDPLAIADMSASETKKITAKNLVQAGMLLIDENSIPWDKVDDPGLVIPNGSIDRDKIQDGEVTNEKIESVDGEKIHDGSITTDKLGDVVDRGLDKDTGKIGHTNEIIAGGLAGIEFDEHGHATSIADEIPYQDLPVATETTIGAVSVPTDSGLTVSPAGALKHANTISGGGGHTANIIYDRNGHIIAITEITPEILPVATPTTNGVVKVPTAGQIGVSADGSIYLSDTGVVPNTYTKVTVDRYGRVTSGAGLTAGDIPNLDASNITSGQFGTNRIADDSITAAKLSDYATCLMQEDFPGQGDFLGQFWYQPSTAQLRVYSRGSGPQNIWLPVGFGLLQQQNLRFAFTFDATTSTISSITQYGAPLGLAVGDPIPVATDTLAGAYGVCVAEGNGITLHDVSGENFTIGDWILCGGEAAGWQHIDVADGAGGGGSQFLNDLLDVDLTIRTPQDGDILKYNGTLNQWINVPDTAHASTGATPPNDATPGTLWWDTESGRLFVWYDDGDTTQWVPATPESGLTGGGDPLDPELKVLNDLEDVQAGKFHGALLQYNAGNLRWESTSTINAGTFTGTTYAVAPDTAASVEPKNLNDLDDVNATNTDKSFLQFNEGSGFWESQLDFDGGVYPITTVAEDFNQPSVIGTATIEKLDDFLDVEVQDVDKAYLIYNDNRNRWVETTTINGGTF